MYDVPSFMYLAYLFEEEYVYKDGSILSDVNIIDTRDVYIRVPVNNIPEEYKVLEQFEDGQTTYTLTEDEFLLLADETKTDELTFMTFSKSA